MGNPFVKIELEQFENASDDASNWTIAFVITLGVSEVSQLTPYAIAQRHLHAGVLPLHQVRLLQGH